MDATLVTGASGAIGQAILKRLTEDGQTVVNLDRSPPPAGSPGDFIEADLTDAAATTDAIRKAQGRYRFTRLVNNAGIVQPATIEDLTLDDLDRVYAVNLRGSVVCMQAVLPQMKEAGFGRVVNISSRASLGKQLRSAYSASKSGVNALARTWSLELAKFGITANAIGPGPIENELWHKVNPPDDPRTKKSLESIPVGRLGTPEDIANAVSFLVDERSGFVNGQVLFVCGGSTVGGGMA